MSIGISALIAREPMAQVHLNVRRFMHDDQWPSDSTRPELHRVRLHCTFYAEHPGLGERSQTWHTDEGRINECVSILGIQNNKEVIW